MNRPIIYVAGPYRSETIEGVKRNIEAAIKQARELAALGFFPIVPHLAVHYDPGLDEDFWIDGWLSILDKCDCMSCLSKDYGKSDGTITEIMATIKADKPLFFSLDQAKYWIDGWHAGTGMTAPEFTDDLDDDIDLDVVWELDDDDIEIIDKITASGDN